MIAHGDELGRTQDGNDDVYAQDSGLSWIDWDAADLRRSSDPGRRRVRRMGACRSASIS